MSRAAGRIGAIYRKELSDILRDRRTLTAMILIPVVLYPLLMLGFVRAAESEEEKLKAEKFVVQVPDESTQSELNEIISKVEKNDPDPPKNRPTWDVIVAQSPKETVGDQAQLQLKLAWQEQPSPFPKHLNVDITYTEVDVHSRTAMNEISKIFQDYREMRTRGSLENFLENALPNGSAAGNVDLILSPVDVKTVSTATEKQRGGWALGQIIPIILVLMTITGAIYPAIDLTAGERERGTLETLMAAPVPVLYLIVGKFLVVATVAMITATLNLGSVGATMHFGGLTQAIAASHMPVKFPLHVLPIILVCMIPFALLFAAILVAVCSFARTFKEAQNYVMPVIIGAMVPGFAVTLPSVELKGAMMVMPVGNMVLLTRELFQQTYTWSQIAIVLLSTSLYAAAAVAVATRLFGQEVVLFADAGSYRTLLQRRYFRPSIKPSSSQALLVAALLFPGVFYVQSLIGGKSLEDFDFIRTMCWLALVQFLGMFVLLPMGVASYFKIDIVNAFSLRLPPLRGWLGAICFGVSSWAIALVITQIQTRFLPVSEAMKRLDELISPQLEKTPMWLILFLLAITPAVCEELLFRGFIMSGLASRTRKWPAILATAIIFGVYHGMIEKVPVTALLGIMLGYLCWQSRSILPGILAHAMHNSAAIAIPYLLDKHPQFTKYLSLEQMSPTSHLSARVLIAAIVVFALGLAFIASLRPRSQRRVF